MAHNQRPQPNQGWGRPNRPMTAAELRVNTEWLGLRQRDLATILGVDERTVRHWLAGARPIPDGIREEIGHVDAFTAAVVRELIDTLRDIPDPQAPAYRTEEDLWAARPETRPYPASWWWMIIARAVAETPGAGIEYANNNPRRGGRHG